MKKGFSWNKVILIFYFASILYFFTGFFTNDPVKLWTGLLVGLSSYFYLLFLIYRRRRFKRLDSDCKLYLHDENIECIYENGTKYQILWKDINRITVNKVKIKEAAREEIWFRLHSYPWRQVFAVPNQADGFQDLYSKIVEWNGFDESKVRDAISAHEAVHYTVWQREL